MFPTGEMLKMLKIVKSVIGIAPPSGFFWKMLPAGEMLKMLKI